MMLLDKLILHQHVRKRLHKVPAVSLRQPSTSAQSSSQRSVQNTPVDCAAEHDRQTGTEDSSPPQLLC